MGKESFFVMVTHIKTLRVLMLRMRRNATIASSLLAFGSSNGPKLVPRLLPLIKKSDIKSLVRSIGNGRTGFSSFDEPKARRLGDISSLRRSRSIKTRSVLMLFYARNRLSIEFNVDCSLSVSVLTLIP